MLYEAIQSEVVEVSNLPKFYTVQCNLLNSIKPFIPSKVTLV